MLYPLYTRRGKTPSFKAGMRAPFLLGLGVGPRRRVRQCLTSVRWVIPSQIGIKCTANNLCHGQTLLLTSFFQLLFLSRCDVDIDPFFGHLYHLLLTSTNILVYNISISERRRQALCWSMSTSSLARKSNMQPSTGLFALSSSSATKVCGCGWMEVLRMATT